MTATPARQSLAQQDDAQAVYVATYAALRRYGARWVSLGWVVTEVNAHAEHHGQPQRSSTEVEHALVSLVADGKVHRAMKRHDRVLRWRAA